MIIRSRSISFCIYVNFLCLLYELANEYIIEAKSVTARKMHRAVRIELLRLEYSVELLIEYSYARLITEVAINYRMVQNKRNWILIQVFSTTTTRTE